MRRLLALSLLVVAAGSGCRMCASPYDYCGPVVDDGCAGGDYQSQPPSHSQPQFQDMPADEPMGDMETSEPVYYEGARSRPPKTATKSRGLDPNVPAAKLPRQAKMPGRTRSF